MSKSHLFLKNEFGISRIFNRTRGRDDDEDFQKMKRTIVSRGRVFIVSV